MDWVNDCLSFHSRTEDLAQSELWIYRMSEYGLNKLNILNITCGKGAWKSERYGGYFREKIVHVSQNCSSDCVAANQ